MAAVKSVNLVLKSVKSIAVRMCPFQPNVRHTREFLEAVNIKKIRTTNSSVEITVDVRHDGSEPTVDVLFVDGERLFMKSAHLTSREMILKLAALCAAKEMQAKDTAKK